MYSTKVIVGLGNPEQDYDRTRHNVGFRALDFFCVKYDIKIDLSDKNVDYGVASISEKEVFVIKPKTYMNLSGSCVKSFTQYRNIEPSNLLVLHDDIDVKLGSIRSKIAGGDAGHKGVRDIIEKLGTSDFSRIRIGIGRPDTDIEISDWVLKRFPPKELEIIDGILEDVALEAFDFVS
tara:strand:- start:11215 stop:11748 length:534 start_codon:yes stop_codon:yes gene_type:complete